MTSSLGISNITRRETWFYSISAASFNICKKVLSKHVYAKSIEFIILIPGDAWVKLEEQDMWLNDISCSRFGVPDGPQTIEDCLVRCTGSCMAVTHVLSENPQRRCYKNANRWQKSLTQNAYCNHYEPSRGDDGKQIEYFTNIHMSHRGYWWRRPWIITDAKSVDSNLYDFGM